MNTVPVATFHELEPAQRLHERLQQAGISAIINDESRRERLWFMSEPLAAVHVEVPQPKYLEARQLIQVWDTEGGVLHSAVRCPECSSSRVEYPQLTRKFITPIIARLFMALGVIGKEFYCLDCHLTWPGAYKLPKKLDILGFPNDSKIFHPENAAKRPRAAATKPR